MRIRLRGAANSPETQTANDQTTRPWVIGLVLLFVFVYCWAFTHIADSLGIPEPADVLGGVAKAIGYEFDSDGNFDSHLYIQSCSTFSNDTERLVLFATVAFAFIGGYFLPLAHKRKMFVLAFCVGFLVLYGVQTLAFLIGCHLLAYLALHGPFVSTQQQFRISAVTGAVAGWLIVGNYYTAEVVPVVMIAAAGIFAFGYRSLGAPILKTRPRVAAVVRSLVMHTPLLIVYVGIGSEGLAGVKWSFPLGVLLFLFQWARLITYHIDFRDNEVPKDLPLTDYLSVFLSPAVIPNHRYAPYLAQGYSYLNSNFYNRDKNEIIIEGVKLWWVALLYLVFADYAVDWFKSYMDERWDVPVYEFISVMVRAYCGGTEMSTPTVLISTFLDQARIFLIYGAVTHFKVGTWRVLGYNVDPQYRRPWLATNLATLWSRFAFHYREYLVRAVYYPVFFRVFKKSFIPRVFIAIMIATVIGNPFWGHTPAKLLTNGITWDRFFRMILRSWPYYVLLGGGISISQIYLMKKVRTRKAWTFDRRFPLDILCSYLTFQYFSLIHIFIRPQTNSTLTDHIKLFLIGLGIHLD